MITDNIATLLTNLFIGYYGKTAHKPRWMAIGCVVTGLSVMITALPFFIYGSVEDNELEMVANKAFKKSRPWDQMCRSSGYTEDCSQVVANSTMTYVAVACFAISNFFRGFGTSIYFTYGTPYLDDNVSKAKMPTFFAFIFAARLFGAPIGFYLSSLALKFYENPFAVPSNLTNSDPRWIGAWWIGFLVSGSLMLLLAIPLSLFPREFKKKPKKNVITVECEALELVDQASNSEKQSLPMQQGDISKKRNESADSTSDTGSNKQELSLRELPGEIYAIITNPMIVCQMLGNMFRGIGIIGHYVFLTKYLEAQFRQSASKASLISGTTGFLGKIVGLLAGGLLITLCRPGPRALTTYLFIVELTSVFTMLYGASVMGPQYAYPKTVYNRNNELDLLNSCNSNCHCEDIRYQPVCEHKDMKAYFSPCHAGCTMSFATADNSSSEYTNCRCADTPTLQKCPPDMDKLMIYATTIAIGSMIAGSGRSGNMVTFFRSINPDQKSLAVAVGSFWHSLFVSIPYPIIYGKIFDYSCLVWSSECGSRGNCWLYDTEKLRYIYHGVTISLIALGSVFDLIMIFLSPRLGNLYDDDDDGKKSLRDRIIGMLPKRKRGVASQAVGSETSPPPPKQASSIPCI